MSAWPHKTQESKLWASECRSLSLVITLDTRGHEVWKFKTKVNKSLLQPFLSRKKMLPCSVLACKWWGHWRVSGWQWRWTERSKGGVHNTQMYCPSWIDIPALATHPVVGVKGTLPSQFIYLLWSRVCTCVHPLDLGKFSANSVIKVAWEIWSCFSIWDWRRFLMKKCTHCAGHITSAAQRFSLLILKEKLNPSQWQELFLAQSLLMLVLMTKRRCQSLRFSPGHLNYYILCCRRQTLAPEQGGTSQSLGFKTQRWGQSKCCRWCQPRSLCPGVTSLGPPEFGTT